MNLFLIAIYDRQGVNVKYPLVSIDPTTGYNWYQHHITLAFIVLSISPPSEAAPPSQIQCASVNAPDSEFRLAKERMCMKYLVGYHHLLFYY